MDYSVDIFGSSVRAGDEISLEILTGEVIEGTVRWARDDRLCVVSTDARRRNIKVSDILHLNHGESPPAR